MEKTQNEYIKQMQEELDKSNKDNIKLEPLYMEESIYDDGYPAIPIMSSYNSDTRFCLDNFYLFRKLNSNIIINIKLKHYQDIKQEVKFRLHTKEHYEAKGKIESLDNDMVIIKNNSGEIIIFLNEISPATIFPADYEPIVYMNDSIKQEDRDYWMNEYKGLCAYKLDGCNTNAEAIDHIMPRALGGLSVRENLRPICNHCNSFKGVKLIQPKTIMEVTNGISNGR